MTPANTSGLFVVSHVGRDLLQSSALFKSEALVVWEYVSNGLQYVDPGRPAEVRVHLEDRRKTIRVADNGRGMDWQGLQQFFVMHGENQDRRQGRPGRGMFGTGKSAAFGIGETLRVRTVSGGRRSEVVLHRRDIEGMASGDPVPVQTVEKEVKTDQPNGTEVFVEDIRLRHLDQAKVIRYVEHHLAHWPDRGAQVFVSNRLCEVAEPEVNWERSYHPDASLAAVLGDVELRVLIARASLDEESRGIAVYSNGNWHENTLAGAEGKECAQYIFGEIDIPRLETRSVPAPGIRHEPVHAAEHRKPYGPCPVPHSSVRVLRRSEGNSSGLTGSGARPKRRRGSLARRPRLLISSTMTSGSSVDRWRPPGGGPQRRRARPELGPARWTTTCSRPEIRRPGLRSILMAPRGPRARRVATAERPGILAPFWSRKTLGIPRGIRQLAAAGEGQAEASVLSSTPSARARGALSTWSSSGPLW